MLTLRQATLRSAAVAALAGLALVQVVGLPYSLAQARHLGVLSGLVAALCVVLAGALAAARVPSGGAAWRAVGAFGALVLGGWVATRLVALPGSATGTGHWTTAPGLASAGLGAACAGLAVAGAGTRPTRAAAAAIAQGCAVVAALVPAVGMLVVAMGPGPSGGERAIAGVAGGHAHVHEAGTVGFRPGFGGHAGHYIYPNATAPHLPAWALALAVGAAALFVYVAAGALRRRAVPAPAVPAVGPARSVATGAAPRALATVLLLLVVFAGVTTKASAHATLLRSVPPAATHATVPPAVVRLQFSEPVEILRASDVSVVDGRGRSVGAAPPRTDQRDPRIVTIALRRNLLPDSYTVRYRVISADSHDIDDALVFALGEGRLRPPVLRGAGGISETSPWAVGARFAELTALGLLLGLLVFRTFVWGPVLGAARDLRPGERATALAAGRRLYWRAFWGCACVAGLAEAYVLAAKSAVVFHTGIGAALTDPAAAYRLVAASRFGDLLGWRNGLLLAIVAIAFWEWAGETSADAPRGAGRIIPTLLTGGLSAGALALLSAQGHASQAPLAPLSVLADALHLAAAGVWLGGLACLAAVLLRAPALLPAGGRRLAAAVATRFSRIAFAAVGVIVLTGLLRLAGELSAVGDLWRTGYGLSVALKLALLCPIAFLALRNRRAIGGGVVRALRRDVRMELAIGLNIVVIAALLVAQIPGRSAPAVARGVAPAAREAAAPPPPGPDGFSRRPAVAGPGSPRG